MQQLIQTARNLRDLQKDVYVDQTLKLCMVGLQQGRSLSTPFFFERSSPIITAPRINTQPLILTESNHLVTLFGHGLLIDKSLRKLEEIWDLIWGVQT